MASGAPGLSGHHVKSKTTADGDHVTVLVGATIQAPLSQENLVADQKFDTIDVWSRAKMLEL